MKCKNCKTKIQSNQKFCPECGAEITNKKKANKSKTFILIVLLVTLCTTLVVAINSISEKREVKADLSVTLDVILDKSSEEAYLYTAEQNYTDVINNEELAAKFNKKCCYDIKKIKIQDNLATVRILFSSPDFYKYLESNVTKLSNPGAIENELIENIDKNIQLKNYEFEIQLKKVGEHWLLKPNAELSNALSGNLSNGYSIITVNIVNKIMG